MSFFGDVWDATKKVGSGALNIGSGGMVGNGPIPSGLAGMATGGGLMMGPLGGVGGLGGLMGGGQQPPQMAPGFGGGGYLPPGYQPGGWPGWPVPPTSPRGAPQSGSFTGDLSGPGQAEAFFDANRGRYGAQTAGSQFYDQAKGQTATNSNQYWNEVSGKMGGAKALPNNAQGAYSQFQGQTPADTSSYYDNAARKATASVQDAAAASGQLGSTTALSRVGDVNANIRGQEAKENAGYGLARAGLAGQLAQGADTSGARGSQDQLAWTTGLGNLALGSDQANLARLTGLGGLAMGADAGNLALLNAGMSGALGAQGMLNTRGQNYFGNNLAMGNALGGATQNIYGQQIGNDLALLDQYYQAMLGYPREGMNQNQNARNSAQSGISGLMGMLGDAKGAGLF